MCTPDRETRLREVKSLGESKREAGLEPSPDLTSAVLPSSQVADACQGCLSISKPPSKISKYLRMFWKPAYRVLASKTNFNLVLQRPTYKNLSTLVLVT